MDEVFRFDVRFARRGNFALGVQIFDVSIVPVPRRHNKPEENVAITREGRRRAGQTSLPGNARRRLRRV